MSNDVSRRTFIKGSLAIGAGLRVGAATAAAAAAAAAATAATATGLAAAALSASGCAPRKAGDATTDQPDSAANVARISSGKYPFAVHEADVIVVGGGMSGLNAARVASNLGSSVILVDKGVVGHSGNSGVLWGQTFVSSDNTSDDGKKGTEFLTIDVMGILDQEQALNVNRAHIEGKPRTVIEMMGNMFQRGDDGHVVGISVKDEVSVTHNSLHKQSAQALSRRGVPIYSNTMMLDILTDDMDRASGIVAISLRDGSAHVFRGKKIILCTGGYHWASGKTGGGPESTGDGHYALLKRGLAFKDMEFPQYDFCGIHPYGYRPDEQRDAIELAVTFPVNGEIHRRMYNKDKKTFTEGFFADPKVQSIVAFQGSLITAAKELYAGNGTAGDGSGNGIYFKVAGMSEEPGSTSYPSYKGIIRYTNANMPNYKFPDFLEVMANEYSSCGVPSQDPATCESEIPGLYTVFVALSAMSSMWNWGQSYLAAKDAATRAKDEAEVLPFSPEDVDAVLDKAYNLLVREINDTSGTSPIRSTEIHRSIQRAFYKGQDFIKSAEKMQAMQAELERIRTEDLPRMICADKSLVFNRDWRMAMEVEGMLACSLATVHAALERKESRSPFFRSDYPKMDNQNYLCYLWTSMDKNWNFKVEKRPVTDSIISVASIREIINDKDSRYDISVANT